MDRYGSTVDNFGLGGTSDLFPRAAGEGKTLIDKQGGDHDAHDETVSLGTSPSYQTTASSIIMKGDSSDEEGSGWTLRRIAMKLSLYANILIMCTKLYAYVDTFSLSVLAALIDSILDVVSQYVLEYAEGHSSKAKRSSALYPAGAARLEPVGVLTCAALMGMASFEVLKQSLQALFQHGTSTVLLSMSSTNGGNGNPLTDIAISSSFDNTPNVWLSFWGMLVIVLVKIMLMVLCRKASDDSGSTMADATLDALFQDHLNDSLSNAVAAVALLCVMASPSLWFVDPLGAIVISVYIIFSWYSTGKEQIEQLTGKAAPVEFIDELYTIARDFDDRMEVDVCRAYHFGPKFLVELEVVLPRDTLLFESHDLGMELQYEIEGKEEVERCFVHIDYETRPYDEHVVSKVPELRERYMANLRHASSCHSV